MSSEQRSARSRSAILTAALELCAEGSYASVTMEAIAARAKVGKPTLYRWWPSKGAVFLDALMDGVVEPYILMPDTGDFERDLRAWLRGFVEMLNDERRRPLMAGLLGTAQHDPALADMIQRQIYRPVNDRNQARIVAAQDRGDLPAIDSQLFEELLIAPLWYRCLITGEPITTDFADALVTAVLGWSRAAG